MAVITYRSTDTGLGQVLASYQENDMLKQGEDDLEDSEMSLTLVEAGRYAFESLLIVDMKGTADVQLKLNTTEGGTYASNIFIGTYKAGATGLVDTGIGIVGVTANMSCAGDIDLILMRGSIDVLTIGGRITLQMAQFIASGGLVTTIHKTSLIRVVKLN